MIFNWALEAMDRIGAGRSPIFTTGVSPIQKLPLWGAGCSRKNFQRIHPQENLHPENCGPPFSCERRHELLRVRLSTGTPRQNQPEVPANIQ